VVGLGLREHNMIKSEGLSPEKERKDKVINDQYINTNIYILMYIYVHGYIHTYILLYTYVLP